MIGRDWMVTGVLVLGLLAPWPCSSQIMPSERAEPAAGEAGGEAANVTPEYALYRDLRNVHLDPGEIYRIREAFIDREGIHISLNDGVIGFTRPVNGRIIGAFFEGEGQLLLLPPNNIERNSLAVFTGTPILEETFTSGFFLFNDDTADEFRSALRAHENPDNFISNNDRVVRSLAEQEALRLFETFLREPSDMGEDRLLRARLLGKSIGLFDVTYDSRAAEQIYVAKFQRSNNRLYYDVLTSFATASPRGDAHAHDIGQQDTGYSVLRGNVRIRSYGIRAQVEPPHTLVARATLGVDVGSGGDRLLLFELSRDLRVKSVEADGHAIQFLQNEALEGSALSRRGNDLVAVIFPEPLQSGEHLEITFSYSGDVLSEAGGGLINVGARGSWYPNRGAAMASFDLEFRTPKEWTLVATGKRISETAEGDDRVSRWISERPIPMAGFNLGQYSEETAKAGQVEVRVYTAHGMESAFPALVMMPPPAPPEPPVRFTRPMGRVPTPPPLPAPEPPRTVFVDPNRNTQHVARSAVEAVQFLSERFGPFPYASLSLAQRPGTLSQGWPGLVFLSSYAFLSPEQRTALKLPRLETMLSGWLMIRHEVAHQWWGDLVGWKSYRDQWLVEALANYSALLSMEKTEPKQVQDALKLYREELLTTNSSQQELAMAGPVTLGLRLSSSRFPNGFDVISYGRGTWLLHMLRHMLGDTAAAQATALASSRSARVVSENSARSTGTSENEQEPFLRTLRRLRERYEGTVLSTADVQRAFEEELPDSLRYEGGKSLDWFFRGWVNGTAIPKFELQGVKLSAKGAATLISGTIRQSNAPDDLVTSIPIYARNDKDTVLLGRVFVEGDETRFQISAPAGTREILLDPYETVLRRP